MASVALWPKLNQDIKMEVVVLLGDVGVIGRGRLTTIPLRNLRLLSEWGLAVVVEEDNNALVVLTSQRVL